MNYEQIGTLYVYTCNSNAAELNPSTVGVMPLPLHAWFKTHIATSTQ